MNNPTLYLYGRETCHLCHDMWADVLVLQTQQGWIFEMVWVDIEDTPELLAQYGVRIPVLTDASGRVLCEGRVDVRQLASAFE